MTLIDKAQRLKYNKTMDNFEKQRNSIKESVLKFASVRCIYFIGSYAYGNPSEKSDVVIPDNINNFLEIDAETIGDLGDKKSILLIYYLDGKVFLTQENQNTFSRKLLAKKEK
jgi:predicted nucleotidyltransferase